MILLIPFLFVYSEQNDSCVEEARIFGRKDKLVGARLRS